MMYNRDDVSLHWGFSFILSKIFVRWSSSESNNKMSYKDTVDIYDYTTKLNFIVLASMVTQVSKMLEWEKWYWPDLYLAFHSKHFHCIMWMSSTTFICFFDVKLDELFIYHGYLVFYTTYHYYISTTLPCGFSKCYLIIWSGFILWQQTIVLIWTACKHQALYKLFDYNIPGGWHI